MKQIGFVGSIDGADLTLYLARLLSFAGKKVVVIDYTKRHLFIKTANVPDVLFGKGSFYKEILVASADAAFSEEEILQYEYVFNYFGAAVNHPQIAKCSEVIFMSDMALYNAELLSGVSCSAETKKRCIIRNAIDVKYKTMFLVDTMKQGFDKSDVVVIPYNEQDCRCHYYLCIDAKHKLKIKELSPAMQDVLLGILAEWENIDDKSLKKIAKNA